MRAASAVAGGRVWARRALRAPALSARLRRRLLVLLALLLLLAGGYRFWLRDSSLVAVNDVTVTGLTSEDADRVRNALEAAAGSMTMLNVDREVLDDATAPYPVVRDLEVRADFPHGLRIQVIEHRPAAFVGLGGANVPVAGDGTVLRGMPVEGRLPAIEAPSGVQGERLRNADALGAARIAGAVPAPLPTRIESIEARSGDGLVVELVDGPELIFGDGSRAEAKWIAAARVLADPEADGATYIDVRIPDRPAAGGLTVTTVTPVAPAGPIGQTGAVPPQATGEDPGAAAGTTAPAPAVPTVPADPATVPGATAPPAGATPQVPSGTPLQGNAEPVTPAPTGGTGEAGAPPG